MKTDGECRLISHLSRIYRIPHISYRTCVSLLLSLSSFLSLRLFFRLSLFLLISCQRFSSLISFVSHASCISGPSLLVCHLSQLRLVCRFLPRRSFSFQAHDHRFSTPRSVSLLPDYHALAGLLLISSPVFIADSVIAAWCLPGSVGT